MIWQEVIGVVATLFIVVAFMQSGEKRIRLLDMIGALLFIVYGAVIHSFSTLLLNSILVGVQVYKLLELRGDKK